MTQTELMGDGWVEASDDWQVSDVTAYAEADGITDSHADGEWEADVYLAVVPPQYLCIVFEEGELRAKLFPSNEVINRIPVQLVPGKYGVMWSDSRVYVTRGNEEWLTPDGE